jgi:hypothetical protein
VVLSDWDGDAYDEMWFSDCGSACDYARHLARECGVIVRVFELVEKALYKPPVFNDLA